MPTSVLVDGQGCEIATIAGPAEWASDDAIKLIKAAVQPATAGFLGGNIEIAADAGAEIGGRRRGLAAQQRLDREFLRIRIRFDDRRRNLLLQAPACIARMLETMLIISIRSTPSNARHPTGHWLTNAADRDELRAGKAQRAHH